MSLFSRFFRKAPPTQTEIPAQPMSAAAARPLPSVPDRAERAATEERVLESALAAHDAATILRLVIEGTSTKVRQRAAQAIEDPDALRQLIRDVRGGNDKSVYRILTQKRDALLVETRKVEHLRAEISTVAAAIERHSQRAHDPLFQASLEQLEHRWRAVAAEADSAVAHRVQEAIDRSREVIAAHLREIAAAASRELAAANAAAELQRQGNLEKAAAASAAAEQARILEAQRREEAEKLAAEALALHQLGGLIRKAQGALNAGSTGRAAGLRRTIEERLPSAPALPVYLANQLQQLDARLNELKDWKSFSVTPKRAELMEEMESLVGASLDPNLLAERIKGLQQEWRTLSRGAGENLEADWQRFQDAAHRAYQPCREYFEAQAQLRQQNLQQREALLARLVAFEAGHDWSQPDWRTVGTALRESRQQWRQWSPVERAEGKALQEKFSAVTDSLQSRLDAEYARNARERELLIGRAQRLLAAEDSRKAIEEVKELQREWQATGPVPHRADRRSWEEFRQHCDAVFQRRQQELAQVNAALEDNKSKAVAVCEELERIAGLPGTELLGAEPRLSELRLGFEALGELPRAETRGLGARFERALARCEDAMDRQRERATERSWSDLLDAANRVRAYKLALVQGADPAEREALRQAADSYIAAVSNWPRGGLEAIKHELTRQGASDLAANELALRELCIRAEILTDIPTPPEDQLLRRQYQVQRLVESMGQGISADAAQLDSLALEWIAIGPMAADTYLPLLERFKRCRARGSRQMDN